ncbi:MAG TPA: hypothetical protein VLE53_09500 [Gemmatimonadaceae bacterium]|nr:hypothetical protein [Gemmatimonadaceae bacterium]
MRMILRGLGVAIALSMPAVVGAQNEIPVREVGPAEAASSETVGFLYGLRELSDGRVLVNDAGRRRLLLFDRALAQAKILADSAAGTPVAYGARPTGIIPYLGDSTLLIDQSARAFLVLDPEGKVARVMSPPRAGDIGFMWNPAIGTPGFDAGGRLIYRSWLMPTFRAPEQGKPFVPPQLPDSAPILAGDFDRRAADTLGWVRVPKRRTSVTPVPGGVRLSAMINPLSTIDDWTLLPDGTIAMLRGQDYHIDWINPDGTRWSSPKMPFDWKRLTDEEKTALVDSTRRALEREFATPGAESGAGAAAASGHGVPTNTNHSMTILGVTMPDGGPPPRPAGAPDAPQIPEVVPASDLPDYVPPVLRSGTMRADPQGNVWILPSTTAQSGSGLLYDVVDRRGVLTHRVRLPAGRALEGFGANGAIYLTSHDAGGTRLERARLK